MAGLKPIVWVGLAAAAAMLVGAFGPWIKVIGLVNTSFSGTDGSNDGWFVVGAALVGGLALLGYAKTHRLLALLTLGGGVVGAAVTIYDRDNVSDAIAEFDSGQSLAQAEIGWGLNLALVASFVLAAVGVIALVSNQRSVVLEPTSTAPPPGE
jgi:hypothetical protein